MNASAAQGQGGLLLRPRHRPVLLRWVGGCWCWVLGAGTSKTCCCLLPACSGRQPEPCPAAPPASSGPSPCRCPTLPWHPGLQAGQGHPMKPHRVRMANSLVLHYGLHSKLDGVRLGGAWRGLEACRPGPVWPPCRAAAASLLLTRVPCWWRPATAPTPADPSAEPPAPASPWRHHRRPCAVLHAHAGGGGGHGRLPRRRLRPVPEDGDHRQPGGMFAGCCSAGVCERWSAGPGAGSGARSTAVAGCMRARRNPSNNKKETKTPPTHPHALAAGPVHSGAARVQPVRGLPRV